MISRMPGMPEEFEGWMGHVCIWPTMFMEIYRITSTPGHSSRPVSSRRGRPR